MYLICVLVPAVYYHCLRSTRIDEGCSRLLLPPALLPLPLQVHITLASQCAPRVSPLINTSITKSWIQAEPGQLLRILQSYSVIAIRFPPTSTTSMGVPQNTSDCRTGSSRLKAMNRVALALFRTKTPIQMFRELSMVLLCQPQLNFSRLRVSRRGNYQTFSQNNLMVPNIILTVLLLRLPCR